MAEKIFDASRLGRFTVGSTFFVKDPVLVREILGWLEFYPHFVGPVQSPPGMEYMGQSPRFDVLEAGDTIPEYWVRVRQCDDGLVFSVERRVVEEARIILPGGKG
jgi:hypothetical protein